MRYRLSSFGKSFLILTSKDNATRKRCNAALAAAAARWPNGNIVKHRAYSRFGSRYTVTRYMVGDCCGILITTFKK